MDSLRARAYRIRLLIYMMGLIVKRSKTLDVGEGLLIMVKCGKQYTGVDYIA